MTLGHKSNIGLFYHSFERQFWEMAREQREQNDQPWSKYTWKQKVVTLVHNTRNNPNIGKRTGKDVKHGKNIRVNEHGLENFEDYFSDEESESSVASFAFGSESVSRREQDKENVLEQENATIQKTNFKVPLRPMSPFSASSQNSDASVASEAKSVPVAEPIEETASQISQSQISSSVINGAGDALGSISRSETTNSKLEVPNSAVQSFRTKKRLTYSAAVSGENFPPDITQGESTSKNSDKLLGKENISSGSTANDSPQSTVEDVHPDKENESCKGSLKSKNVLRTSPRKSAGNAVSSQTMSQNLNNEGEHLTEFSNTNKTKAKRSAKGEVTEKDVPLRRSSRNRNKEKLHNEEENKMRDVRATSRNCSARDKKHISDIPSKKVETVVEEEADTCNDEYDFTRETEPTEKISKPKSKKNLKDAFEASVRSEEAVTEESQTLGYTGTGNTCSESSKSEFTNKKVTSQNEKNVDGTYEGTDGVAFNSDNDAHEEVMSRVLSTSDARNDNVDIGTESQISEKSDVQSSATERNIIPTNPSESDDCEEKSIDQKSSKDTHKTDTQSNIPERNGVPPNTSESDALTETSTDDKSIGVTLETGTESTASQKNSAPPKRSESDDCEETSSNDKGIEERPHVKTGEKEWEKNYAPDSSDDEGGVFLSLSKKSMIIPDTQSQPDDEDNDDEFEMVNSPIQKKKISSQLRRERSRELKGIGDGGKKQNNRRSHLEKKLAAQSNRAGSERGSEEVIPNRTDKSKTSKSKSTHLLRNFVFSESNSDDVTNEKNQVKKSARTSKTSIDSSDSNDRKNPKSSDIQKNQDSHRSSSDSDSESRPRELDARSNKGEKPKRNRRGKTMNSGKANSEQFERKRTGLRQTSNTNNKPNDQPTKETKRRRKNSKRKLESIDEGELSDVNTSENPVLSLSTQEQVGDNVSPPGSMPMPVGSSSKPVVRRSRSSLTVVSKGNRISPVANIMNILRASPTDGESNQQENANDKGVKTYNKYTHLLGDFEEEFETSVSDNLARTIDKSVSRALSLLTTPGKSPATRKSPKSDNSVEKESSPTVVSLTALNVDGTESLGTSPQLNQGKKRPRSGSETETQSAAEALNDASKNDNEDDDTPVVKKKKKGKVKRITPSPKAKSTNRKRSVSSGSVQGVQHKRVKHLKGKDRRGSISTSTPIAKDGRRQSVGFAFTPSPGGRNGTIDSSTPRSILKNTSVLPRYSVTSPLHYHNVTNSPKPTPIRKPSEKIVKIVEPEDEENLNLRRSRRARCKPLAWYAGERINYNRRKSGAVIVGILNPAEQNKVLQEYIDPINYKKTNKIRRKKVQKVLPPPTPRNMSIHGEVPADCDSSINSSIIPVINPHDQEEKYQECVRTRDSYYFRGPTGNDATAEDPLVISKFLNQETFSMGQLIIRPLEAKDSQYVNCTMVFYVMYGKLAVEIHRTTRLLESGDSFFVPPGNTYAIQNLRNDEAKLLFFQMKESKKKRKKKPTSRES